MVRAQRLGVITERQARHLRMQRDAEGRDEKDPDNLNLVAEKPRAFKRMAEVLHGIAVNLQKVAAYNISPIPLTDDIMKADAGKPDRPAREKKQEQYRSKVVSVNRKS